MIIKAMMCIKEFDPRGARTCVCAPRYSKFENSISKSSALSQPNRFPQPSSIGHPSTRTLRLRFIIPGRIPSSAMSNPSQRQFKEI